MEERGGISTTVDDVLYFFSFSPLSHCRRRPPWLGHAFSRSRTWPTTWSSSRRYQQAQVRFLAFISRSRHRFFFALFLSQHRHRALPSPAKFIACASSLLNSSRSHAHNPLSLHLHLLGLILFAKLHARCRLPSRRAKRRRVPRRRGQLVQVSQPFNHLWF
jgi:hypothetical protein